MNRQAVERAKDHAAEWKKLEAEASNPSTPPPRLKDLFDRAVNGDLPESIQDAVVANPNIPISVIESQIDHGRMNPDRELDRLRRLLANPSFAFHVLDDLTLLQQFEEVEGKRMRVFWYLHGGVSKFMPSDQRRRYVRWMLPFFLRDIAKPVTEVEFGAGGRIRGEELQGVMNHRLRLLGLARSWVDAKGKEAERLVMAIRARLPLPDSFHEDICKLVGVLPEDHNPKVCVFFHSPSPLSVWGGTWPARYANMRELAAIVGAEPLDPLLNEDWLGRMPVAPPA